MKIFNNQTTNCTNIFANDKIQQTEQTGAVNLFPNNSQQPDDEQKCAKS